MISRRSILLNWLGANLLGPVILDSAGQSCFARGRKQKAKPEPVLGGPRTLSRQEWPPAITPEYVGIVDRGYACLADDMGRLAVVDLKREDNPQVIGELFGIGRKVVAFSITQHRAFAVVQVDSGADTIFQLVTVSLTPANDISIMSRTTLGNFSEPDCISSSGDQIAIGGKGLNNENQIVIYTMGKRKSVEPMQVSALTIERSPFLLLMQDRQIMALCGPESTDLVLLALSNPRAPELLKSIPLQGSFRAVARNRDQIMIAGTSFEKNCQARLINMRPSPQIVSSVVLPSVTEVLDLAAQKGQFLLLANQGARQAVIPLIMGRKNSMSQGSAVLLPQGAQGGSPEAHIAVKDKDAYIATDGGQVQVLNVNKKGWQFSYSHNIPRLPASAVVIDGNLAVIACAELKLYDLKDPRHPVLLSSTDIPSTIRSMLQIGNTFLCLSRDSLTLRSITKPSEQRAKLKVNGSVLAYDRSLDRVYVVSANEKGSVLQLLSVRNDSIKDAGKLDLPLQIRKAVAVPGELLVASLSELSLYAIGETMLLGTRKLPNFAIRDMLMGPDRNIYLACVDENLNGSLLILDGGKEDLGIKGACQLPLDAGALALAQDKVVIVGRGKSGKDMLAIVNITSPSQPKLVESFETLEAASAIGIKDKMAVIAGRGLELIDLS